MKSLIVILLALSTTAFPQDIDFNRYKGLECKGKLPKVFTSSLQEKVADHKNEILKSSDKFSEKKGKKKFALQASYSLSELVLNGQVLFGDELTNYVSEVGELILNVSSHPKRNQVEFFVVKSPYVNAFTTNEGKIFVTVGLIAQLETEAQLAFILAHEIAHFEHNHVLDGFLLNRKLDKKSSTRYSGGEALLRKSVHSKERELEADDEGLKLFLKTPYGTSSLYGVFDILQFAHLPIDEVEFDPAYLENENFSVSDEYILDSIRSIELPEDYENSTHPSAEKRAKKITEVLEIKSKKGKHFIFGSKTFKLKRNIARFELSNILFQKRKYQALLYNNYVLSQDFENNYFVDYSNARALYFLTKYKLRNETENIVKDSDEIQGESQSLYYMVENMPNQSFAIMSVSYIWKLAQKYPDDKKFKDLSLEILKECIYVEDIDEGDFIKMNKKDFLIKKEKDSDRFDNSEDNLEMDKEEGYTYKRSSKYKKINQKIEEQEKGKVVDGELEITSEQSVFYAFGGLFDDPDFSEMFKKAYLFKAWRSDYDSEIAQIKANKRDFKKWKKKNEIEDFVWNDSKEKSLGIESLIFVDPMHLIFDKRRKEIFRIESTSEKQMQLREIIKESSNTLNMKTIILDSKDLNVNETERFNDIILLNQMLKELNVHSELDSIVLSDFSGLREIAQKYETSKIGWNIMLSFTEKDKTTGASELIAAGACLFPSLPFFIFDAATPDIITYNFFFVYDIETSKLVYRKKSKIEGNIPKSVIRQNIYHHMSQINRKPKKKSKS